MISELALSMQLHLIPTLFLIIHELSQMSEQLITLLKNYRTSSISFRMYKKTRPVPNGAICFYISRSNTDHLNQQCLTLGELNDIICPPMSISLCYMKISLKS